MKQPSSWIEGRILIKGKPSRIAWKWVISRLLCIKVIWLSFNPCWRGQFLLFKVLRNFFWRLLLIKFLHSLLRKIRHVLRRLHLIVHRNSGRIHSWHLLHLRHCLLRVNLRIHPVVSCRYWNHIRHLLMHVVLRDVWRSLGKF